MKVNIPFSQNDLIHAHTFGGSPLPSNLKKINKRYNGLCEIICNKILIDDDLGKGTNKRFHKDNITASALQRPEVIKSHMLEVYPFIQKIRAFFSKKYPDNILSYKDQKKLVRKKAEKGRVVKKSVLKSGLNSISVGDNLKMQVFKKGIIHFSGHALLIKKVGQNEFIFFDPDNGETSKLTFQGLVEKINEQIEIQKGTDIFLLKGSVYLDKLRKKKILKT